MSNNSVVAAVVAGVISLVVSLVVSHYQNANAGSQAAADQQVQSALELEAAATSLFQSATDLYNYEVNCYVAGDIWQVCTTKGVQAYPNYTSPLGTFAAAGSNIADRTAAQLANQFEGEAVDIMKPQSVTDADRSWNDLLATYDNLITRCGNLVRRNH